MRICFIGHSFHKQTRSSKFFTDMLSEIGDVTELQSSPDESPLADDDLLRDLVAGRFDLYVFWQTEYLAARLAPFALGRMILVPMYDGVIGRPEPFWRQFVDATFVSFSRVHHETLRRLNCNSHHFQYYPPVAAAAQERAFDADRSAFFWERRPGVMPNWQFVVAACHALEVRHLHIHAAPDFKDKVPVRATYPQPPSSPLKISTSTWFEDKEEFARVSNDPLFYFAPRQAEGIGMAVLEAMARGQIVVAPDVATMNEYIAHNVSGILYDLESEFAPPLMAVEDLSRLSRAAHQKASLGAREWQADLIRLKSILSDDGRRWTTRDSSSHHVNAIRRAAHQAALAGNE